MKHRYFRIRVSSVFHLWQWLVLAALLLPCNAGCVGLFHGFQSAGPPPLLDNPLFVPPMDREQLWCQVVDAIDDYFRIEHEERVRQISGILTEGRIDTFPTIGSTIFEPWRGDSTGGYEKVHATLQSIRRRATARVIPTEGGYLLDVVVQKELEDLDKPEHATAGGATLRHDGTLIRQEGAAGRYSVTLGWIPIGRDVSLEQRILADVAARLGVQGLAGQATAVSGPVTEELYPSPLDVPGPVLGPAQDWQLLPNMETLPTPPGR